MNDYIETMLPIILARPALEFHLTCLVLELNEFLDCDSVSKLLLDLEIYEPIFQIIKILTDT